MADVRPPEFLEVLGARVHNLKDIDVRLPRNRMVVITGISGSGKSSLAFDTIYAEGQRRYLESFSTYARQYMGSIERPDVDKITGLSPVISIEQKTVSKNPRSTVGTVTEVYDFLRLLFARASHAYSYNTGERMVQMNEDQILQRIRERFDDRKVVLLAPMVRGRKGHYRELFERLRKRGYLKARVDGEITDIEPGMKVDRYKTHDIEAIIDRLRVAEKNVLRLRSSVELALQMGEGLFFLLDAEADEVHPFSRKLMCPETGISYDEPSPNSFSYNSPYGSCPTCKGLGYVYDIDMDLVIPDDSVSINKGGIAPIGERRENAIFRELKRMAKRHAFSLSSPVRDLPADALDEILYGKNKTKKPPADDDRWYTLKYGLIDMLQRCFAHSSSDQLRRWAEEYMSRHTCSTCDGFRLQKESLWFKIADHHIGQLASMSLRDLAAWFEGVEDRLDDTQNAIARDVLKEIRERTGFLLDVGLGYLSLDRPARSLSGGEAQRIRLATQIGSQLSGVTYILDEPSIGLHQRDNEQLIASLKKLTANDNTVFVVEHDKDIMLECDHLIDLGPGAGEHGGELVAEGTPADFIATQTLTADYLAGRRSIAIPDERRAGTGKTIKVRGARGNNLQDVDVAIPLGTFTCVTGVSGSGKSTLINETLYPILRHHCYGSFVRTMPHEGVKGLKHVDKVIEIDQSPIGRTPRSNPATYTKLFDDIRKLFAQTPEAKIRGYKPGRFSFNVKGGRCEECKGGGVKVLEMNFLPDVHVECPTCRGRRYNRETLEVRYKGKTIADVLDMTVEEGVDFFEPLPRIHRKLKTLLDVGLGYIRLGQSSTTVSGGEAQRIKLASELSKKDTGNTVYILDEPTTGLHFEDIRVLLGVLQRLVDHGNTVLVIEHNLDVIKVADHVIDLGPEGGERGGTIVATGTPEEVAEHPTSHTARFLKKELAGG